jgi:acetolactate synthase small subunit
MPIDKVTGKRRESIAEEHILVIEKKAEGKGYREIAEITRISKSQVAEIVKE